MKKTVPDMLREAAKVYEERNRLYGDNYKKFGHVMAAMWPEGLDLRTADQFNRMGIFVQMVAKLTRYAAQFGQVGGHEDSLIDLTVYSQMLRELDLEQVAARKKETEDFLTKSQPKKDWLADIKIGDVTEIYQGLIPWHGSDEPPVPSGTRVEYRMRVEPEGAGPHFAYSEQLRWRHEGNRNDIILYRVVQK